MKQYEVLIKSIIQINLKRQHITWSHLCVMSRNGQSTETESNLGAGGRNKY